VSTKRILLAESNPLYRQAIAQILAKIKGVKVVDTVGTGWEVLQVSTQLKPDVILMDFNLPGLNGLEATRLIKQQLTNVHIVLFLDEENKQYISAVEQSGAWTYLIKSQLGQELNALLDKIGRTNGGNAYSQVDTQPEH
jgi:DNA-binding NarL/FixJ family response regulator